jgi:drug/metabolite transporter (DMT)-like permease
MLGRTRRQALTEGLIAGVLFGTASVFIRLLSLDAFSIAFWRLVIASLALTAVLIVSGKSFNFSILRRNIKQLLLLSFFLGLHFVFFISAVKDTTILNATVLVNTTPIFSIFVSNFMLKLKPSRHAVFGVSISFIGIFLIAYAETTIANQNLYLTGHTSSIRGDLEAILAALAETVYLNYGRKIRSQMSIVTLMLPIYALTAGIVAALGILTANATLTLQVDAKTILPLVGLGLLPTAIAHTLYFSSLSNLKAFETATMAFIEPIGATVLGMLIFEEIPAPLFAVGAALTLLGILFIVRDDTETYPTEKSESDGSRLRRSGAILLLQPSCL